MIKMEHLSDSGNASINSSGLSNGSVSSSSGSAGSSTNGEYSAEYLAQLLKDKKQLAAFPNVFAHLERLVDDEVQRVRVSLFHLQNEKMPLVLPEPQGPVIQLQEKLFVPVKDHPEYNFVGRILGPRGMTAKQLEQETGCKIMIRGKGSMRDKQKEEQNRGKPNWEHLTEELHVLLSIEDTENRAKLKLQRAMEDVKKLLVPAPEGEDDLKRKQLMELAIINGTYRPVVPDTKKQLPFLQYYPGSCVPMMQTMAQQPSYYFSNGVTTGGAYYQPTTPTSYSSLLSPTGAASVPENPSAMAAAAAAAARLLPTAASLQFAAAALGNPLRQNGQSGMGGLLGNPHSMGPATLGAPIILSPTRLGPHMGGGVPGSGAPGHAHLYSNQNYPGAQGVVTSLAMSMSGQSPTGLSSMTPGMAAGLFSGNSGGMNVSCGQSLTSADLQQMMASAGLMYSPLDPSLAAAYPYQAAALTSGLTSPLLAGEYPGLDTHAGAILNQRRMLGQTRDHPYARGAAVRATPPS